MNNDLLYQIALTLIPHIGDVRAKALIEKFGDAEHIFRAPKRTIEQIEGIGSVAANAIKDFSEFTACEEEIRFIEKNNIRALFLTDSDYPQRLLNCFDSPTLLFYKGNADLNASKIISIVGTRNNSDYGKNICEKITAALSAEDVLIVSGLAFGIDTIAHKTSLKNNLKTVGVLAHGLDKIYPSQNKQMAKEMLSQGGLLTDFTGGTDPDRQNFPRRNRIVAGICDALVVIESKQKGGSLITAELANGYNKDVFAIPGRVNDAVSEGCNSLIKSNKAQLITGADDLLEIMNWKAVPKKIKVQREMFIELTPDEKIITDLLGKEENMQIDRLYLRSGLSSSAAANALLMLEMQGIVTVLPGKVFKLA
ncbi:MAG: DNA-processing protein DprA [Ferruginibacter sp.]